MSNQHEKSEPKPEEETNPFVQALRGAKGERRQEIQRVKKQLDQDLQKKIMEYIEVLGISKSVADAARLGKTSVKIDIRGAQNHFQRYYNTTDVFNFVENKSMELRFEKKWTEFFHEFKKTIAVDDLKESCLLKETYIIRDTNYHEMESVGLVWPELTHFPTGGALVKDRTRLSYHVYQASVLASSVGKCNRCRQSENHIMHQPEYLYPDFLIVKWK